MPPEDAMDIAQKVKVNIIILLKNLYFNRRNIVMLQRILYKNIRNMIKKK